MRRLILLLLAALGLTAPAAAQPAQLASRVTAVEVKAVAPDRAYDGVAYVKISGTVRGIADPREAVVGIAALPKNAAGQVEWASNFEIIAPGEGQPANEVLYLDTENRGSAISQGALGGFLQTHKTSYARVQWQTGISAGVPQTAQGLGLVILRDFGRWLGGRARQAPAISGGFVPPAHAKLMIGGISQSAWTVNTLIAEGFNVDPASNRGVFDAAIAVDGIGNWLAINQLGAARNVPQTPYVEPNGPPLSRTELLKRPATDPLYVDIANYTDFYRLRAGLTSTDFSGPRFRRYDFPSPHAVATPQGAARCGGGEAGINTVRYAPYMRAIVLSMEKAIGVRAAQGAKDLPPSAPFVLTGAPPPSPGFNALPGFNVRVPATDRGWPRGGVRFPEAVAPLGQADPAALSPAVTTSISETCGNFGGFAPTPLPLLTNLYGSKEGWLKDYTAALDRLIDQGFLLAEDRAGMLDAAGRTWPQ